MESRIREILEYYNHTLKVENGLVSIEALKKSSGSIRGHTILLCILLVAAIPAWLFLPRKAGYTIIVLVIASLFKVMSVRQREMEAHKRNLEIGNDYIEVSEKFRRDKISFEEISEFQINTKMEGKFAVGSIIVLNQQNLPLKIVELIGKNEDDVAEDLEAVANYINEELIEKE